MISKSGYRFPACAKPVARFFIWVEASAGEGRAEKIMRQQKDTVALVERVLLSSLAAWHVDGQVERDADRITLTAGEQTLKIARGAPPFRWMVTLAGRDRGVTSIAGLLRTVRRVVDPDHPASRLRIAPSRLVPP